ncbi:MAG: helix-turn-helix transcriptional regulator [Lachnospiraceae bacterium]|nr:helix-turn-helix transcriptional regulator [Lachnospiraceae bacterium]
MEREDFCKRLTQLRMNKGVSARDMSLSIGQSPNYIIGIEGGKNYPSMETFFYICDYFGITPKEFFDLESTNPSKATELIEIIKSLPNDQLDLFIALGKAVKK